MKVINETQNKRYRFNKSKSFKKMAEEAKERERRGSPTAQGLPEKAGVKIILLDILLKELRRAIAWKLSERFRISKEEETYECFPQKIATKEPYKSQNMFLVIWKGFDAKTGERRKSYKPWSEVKALLHIN